MGNYSSTLPNVLGKTLAVKTNTSVGKYLTDGAGRTLYVYLPDTTNRSNCYGACAAKWPPLSSMTKPALSPSSGLNSNLVAEVPRLDLPSNMYQISYYGWPLYYYYLDTKPGDIKGQGIDNLWYVLGPDGNPIKKGVQNNLRNSPTCGFPGIDQITAITTDNNGLLVDNHGNALYGTPVTTELAGLIKDAQYWRPVIAETPNSVSLPQGAPLVFYEPTNAEGITKYCTPNFSGYFVIYGGYVLGVYVGSGPVPSYAKRLTVNPSLPSAKITNQLLTSNPPITGLGTRQTPSYTYLTDENGMTLYAVSKYITSSDFQAAYSSSNEVNLGSGVNSGMVTSDQINGVYYWAYGDNKLLRCNSDNAPGDMTGVAEGGLLINATTGQPITTSGQTTSGLYSAKMSQKELQAFANKFGPKKNYDLYGLPYYDSSIYGYPYYGYDYYDYGYPYYLQDYQNFKKQANKDQFLQFLKFNKWYKHCKKEGKDWKDRKIYRRWIRRFKCNLDKEYANWLDQEAKEGEEEMWKKWKSF